MFDLPNAKRVRREDLTTPPSTSPASSRPSSPEVRAFLEAQCAFETKDSLVASNDRVPNHTAQDQAEEQCDKDEEEGLAFNLFRPLPHASTKGTAQASQVPARIHLAPSGIEYKARSRPQSYYFAPAPSPAQKARFASSAINGLDIISSARKRAPGLQCPWRVMRVVISRKHVLTLQRDEAMRVDAIHKAETRKGRKGKKARIKLRKKHQLISDREERDKARRADEEAKAKEKDAYLAEKKRKMNSKKQRKKREKARLAKAQGDGGEEASGAQEYDSGESELE